MKTDIKTILEEVKEGKLSIDYALLLIKKEPFEDIGYAKIDLHRSIRQGMPEVIYGESKTSNQIIGIVSEMMKHDQDTILITRLAKEKANEMIGETTERFREIQESFADSNQSVEGIEISDSEKNEILAEFQTKKKEDGISDLLKGLM